MDDSQVEFLANLVAEHSLLYDPTDPEYKNADLHRQVWIEIAETLGIEAEKCK